MATSASSTRATFDTRDGHALDGVCPRPGEVTVDLDHQSTAPTGGELVHRALGHEATVVDGNLISARTPADLGPWMKALLAALA